MLLTPRIATLIPAMQLSRTANIRIPGTGARPVHDIDVRIDATARSPLTMISAVGP